MDPRFKIQDSRFQKWIQERRTTRAERCMHIHSMSQTYLTNSNSTVGWNVSHLTPITYQQKTINKLDQRSTSWINDLKRF